MAFYSGARQRLIPPGGNDPRIIPVGVILHVDAGNSGSLYDYFANKSGGIESHLFIRKDGGVEQYRDTAYEADANYRGNSFVRNGKTYGFISVETQGLAAGEWTSAQLAEIKKFLLWTHKTHGIPLRRCSAWDQAGVGYHVMFGAPGPWTPVSKSCPGPDRVKQFNNILVPWLAHATTPVEDEDMPLTEAEWTRLGKLVYDKNYEYGGDLWAEATGTGTKFIASTKAQLAALTGQVAGLTAALQALAQNQGVDPAAVLAAVTAATENGVDKALADLKITLTTDDEV